MLVEKVNPEDLLLLTSHLYFKSAKMSATAVKEAIKAKKYVNHFGKEYAFQDIYKDYRKTELNPLYNRWDLYPFFNQMWIDLCKGQHYLTITPSTYCEWKPRVGDYAYENRIKRWIEKYGEDTEVVYTTEDEADMWCSEIYNGLNGCYKGEYSFCYDHDEWIALYHITMDGCQDYGGICLWMNKYDYSIKIFGIGEDDGFVFPETSCYKDYVSLNEYEKIKLLQLVNDISIKDFDNQKIIEQIWNYPIFVKNKKA